MTTPSLWQLRVFEAVGRLGSMSRAAREVLRSQPAVTLSILRLEQLLEISLFDRAATGTYLSPAGAFMAAQSREILAEAERAVANAAPDATQSALGIAAGITKPQIRVLIAMGEARSFQDAAAHLRMSSASLQRLARQLEKTIGVDLYRHTATGTVLTPTGAQLAQSLKTVDQRIDAMVEQLVQRRRQDEPGMKIGVQLMEPNQLLSRAILVFSQEHPDVRITVVSDRFSALVQRLRAHEIDVVLGVLSEGDGEADLAEEPICTEHYRVVARRDHPLAKSAVTADQLRGYGWILPPAGPRRLIAFEHIFADGRPPQGLIETHSHSAARMVLSESDRLTVLSHFEAIGEARTGPLAALDFTVPGPGRVIGFITGQDRTLGEVPLRFMEALRSAARQLLTVA